MFLMKFSSLSQKPVQKPLVSTRADLVDYNALSEISNSQNSAQPQPIDDVQSLKETKNDNNAPSSQLIEIEAMAVPDIKLPDWYSVVGHGDIKTAKKPLHLLDEADFATMKPKEIRKVTSILTDEILSIPPTKKLADIQRILQDENDPAKLVPEIIKGFSALEDEKKQQFMYEGKNSEEVSKDRRKLLRDEVDFEKKSYQAYLKESTDKFLKFMNDLTHGTEDPTCIKTEIIMTALKIYYIAEFEGLIHAKRHLQDLIIQAHGNISANNPLTAFEYAIMCCVSQQDFLFDKNITDLSNKQQKYRLALGKDDVSGEDNNLEHEICLSHPRYEIIIQEIQTIISRIIREGNEMKRLSLETELRDKILQFRSLNSQERINLTLYTVAEIAMQTYCTLLAQDAKIRERFFNSDPALAKHQPNQELIRQWILSPEFVDPQSELRNELWSKFEDETKYRFDVVRYCKQLLIDAAKERISYSSLGQAPASQIAAGMPQPQSSRKSKLQL